MKNSRINHTKVVIRKIIAAFWVREMNDTEREMFEAFDTLSAGGN
jgi:hypothetical protein